MSQGQSLPGSRSKVKCAGSQANARLLPTSTWVLRLPCRAFHRGLQGRGKRTAGLCPVPAFLKGGPCQRAGLGRSTHSLGSGSQNWHQNQPQGEPGPCAGHAAGPRGCGPPSEPPSTRAARPGGAEVGMSRRLPRAGTHKVLQDLLSPCCCALDGRGMACSEEGEGAKSRTRGPGFPGSPFSPNPGIP